MEIQIDSREKAKAIKGILAEFESLGVKYFSSKLFVGDYLSLDNSRLCIDRKQNLTELCENVCQQHQRFKAELTRAQEMGIKLIILCEHGGKIKSMDAVKDWINPRQSQWEKKIMQQYGIPKTADFKLELADLKSHGAKIQPPPTSGEQLFKMLTTIGEKYEVGFEFCDKKTTGSKIIQLLGGEKS